MCVWRYVHDVWALVRVVRVRVRAVVPKRGKLGVDHPRGTILLGIHAVGASLVRHRPKNTWACCSFGA